MSRQPVKEPREVRTCVTCKKEKNIPKGRIECPTCRSWRRNLRKEIVRPPEYPEVNTQSYKDPMREVEDGFGFYGAIRQTNDGEHIQCHICGYYFSRLAVHISRKHKMSTRDYKFKYGLKIRSGLLSDNARKRAQKAYNEHLRPSPAVFAAMSLKGRQSIKAKGIRISGPGWNEQKRNETGTCKEQTLDKIRHIAAITGGYPTFKAYRQEFGNSDIPKFWFGSWSKAVAAAGLPSWEDERAKRASSTKEEIVKGIKRFFTENGRTPLFSDFNSETYLPSHATVQYHFGNLNSARQAAGVPLMMFSPQHKWLEVES